MYISSTNLDNVALVVIAYFRELFLTQKVRSPLQQPIIMLFDPELKNNKLDIKVSGNNFDFLGAEHPLVLLGELPVVQ